MNLPANSFSDLEANFNSNLTTLRDSINNKLNADFTDIKNNLDKTCRNINNLTIGSGGGHNHTVNFFSNNFNEFADHSGEPCGKQSRENCEFKGGPWNLLPGKTPGPSLVIVVVLGATVKDSDEKHKLIPGLGIEQPDYTPIEWQSGDEIDQNLRRNNINKRFKQIMRVWRNSFITQGEGTHNHRIDQPRDQNNQCDENISYLNDNISIPSVDPVTTFQVRDINREGIDSVNIIDSIPTYSLMFFIKKPAVSQ